MTCNRCEGRGFIRQCVLRLDDVAPGQPQTATVIEVREPEVCPDCGGKRAAGRLLDGVEHNGMPS